MFLSCFLPYYLTTFYVFWFIETFSKNLERVSRHLVFPQPVENCLEVVEKYNVREAFEDKSKLPEWIDASNRQDCSNGQDVEDDKADAETHAEKQNAESRRRLNELRERKLVVTFDVP